MGLMQVECPVGAGAGQRIKIMANGAEYEVEVPAGIVAGQTFQIEIPDAAPQSSVPIAQGVMVQPDAIEVEDLLNGMYRISYAVPSAGDWTMTLGIDENAYDDDHIFHQVYGFPMKHKFGAVWRTYATTGPTAKLKGYTRVFSPEKNKVYVYVKDIPNDKGFPDLKSDKDLGFKVDPPPKPAGEEGEEGEEGAEPGEGGDEATAEEEADAAEPAPPPAPEPEPEPEAQAEVEETKAVEPARPPDLVCVLSLDSSDTKGEWTQALSP